MSNQQTKRPVELPTALKNLRFVQDVIDGQADKKVGQSSEATTFTEDINRSEWSMKQMMDNLIQNNQKSLAQQMNSTAKGGKGPVIILGKKKITEEEQDQIDNCSRSMAQEE